MDPVTHSLTGSALGAAGLRKASPLATATLVLAANAPDIDILATLEGEYAMLAFRRGWSHGPVGWLVLPFVVVGVVLAWDRVVRRRRGLEPARAGPLLALAALGVLTHPALDFLNIYGIRLLAPFSGRWFYGDVLFIVDPWVWLLLGGATFMVYSRAPRALARWSLGAGLAVAVLVVAPMVTITPKLLWAVGLMAVASVRLIRRPDPRTAQRLARAGLALAVGYTVLMVGLNHGAERVTRAELAADGLDVEEVMVAPVPMNPLRGEIVAVEPQRLHKGRFRWALRDRVAMDGPVLDRLTENDLARLAVVRALRDPRVRDFLVWARFPFVRVDPAPDGGLRVRIGDARYSDFPGAGGLGGVTVDVGGGPPP